MKLEQKETKLKLTQLPGLPIIILLLISPGLTIIIPTTLIPIRSLLLSIFSTIHRSYILTQEH